MISGTHPCDIDPRVVRHVVHRCIEVVYRNLALEGQRVKRLQHAERGTCRGIPDCGRVELEAEKLIEIVAGAVNHIAVAVPEHDAMPPIRVEDHHV